LLISSTAVDVIDVDQFAFKDTVLEKILSGGICEGYKLDFPDGKSAYACYPFALHDVLVLPWDFKVKNGVMTLFARSCSGKVKAGATSCIACQHLVRNVYLEGIITRIKEGVHENTPFAYFGFSGLLELLRRKTRQIEFYRLRGLNQARKLLSKATALTLRKRLLMAIASGKVNRVDQLIDIALRQKKGVRAILAAYRAAGEGVYKPKSFTEEEDMKALLMWKLSGNRVAEINHRANDGPSVSYLRAHSTVPTLIHSPGQPTINEVQKNVEATFTGVLDVMHELKVIHAVVMFDEIAAEKRIHWDLKSNHFLGVCREHANKTSMEFINEGDMDKLFKKLDDGEVHYAAEVRTFQI
jgi:hypothetical protein